MLKTAFDYEIRNFIDINKMKLTEEEDAETLRILQIVRDYLTKRIEEMKT
jgi:hypothetical protein